MSTNDPAVAKRFKASSYTGNHAAQVTSAIAAAASYAAAGDVNGDLFDDTGRQWTLLNTTAAITNQKCGPNALQCIAEDDVGGPFNVTGSRCLVMQNNVRLEFSKDVSIAAGTTTCMDFIKVDGVSNFTICAKASAFNTQRNPGGANVFHPEWSVGKVICDLRGHTPGSGTGLGLENIRFSGMDGSGAGGGPAHFKYQNLFIIANNNCTAPGWKQDQSLFTPRGGDQNSAAKYGIFIDMDFDGQYSGYGAWQNSSCWRTLWANIRSHGGTPLRQESDGKFGGSDLDWGISQVDMIALYGEDCNKVFTVQPNKVQIFNSWYVDGVYGISCLEVGNAGQYRTAGTPAGADQTMDQSVFGEIWCITGDHSAWQEESPCQSNRSVATWANSGFPGMTGTVWGSMKYNLGHGGGPGHGVDGAGAELDFVSRADGTHYNGTRDTTITPATMRARWASKKVSLGSGGVTAPGKPTLTGPAGPQDEPFRVSVYGTVDKTASWEWRLTKDGVAGSWLNGATAGTKDMRRYGCLMGVRTLDQVDYPSAGQTTDTVPWIDHLEDDIFLRNLDFRNCYVNITTATNGGPNGVLFNDTRHGQTVKNTGSGMEWGAWWRGEVAYIQLHGRRRQPSLPQGVFTSAIAGDDCFWDNTAPNIPATDPQWPTGPKGVVQGDFDAVILALASKLNGMVYPNNATCQALGIVGQPVKYYWCFHHEPVNDFAVQGYPSRSAAGPHWAAAFNHWVNIWNGVAGGMKGLLGYVGNLTNDTFNGQAATNPSEWTGHLNFPFIPSGDAYVHPPTVYVPDGDFDGLTDGQYQYSLTVGEAHLHGELGYDTSVSGGVTMEQWMDDLQTTVETRRNILGICFQANKEPTQPYLEEIHEDSPLGTQAAFQAVITSDAFLGLAAGVYKLEARCTNAGGTGPVSNPYQITINSTGGTLPLKATIDSGPTATTTASSATFTFSSTGATSFEASLDGATFAVQTSPHTYTGLDPGVHTLVVHGLNADGTGPNSNTYAWTVLSLQDIPALVLSGTAITDKLGKFATASNTTLGVPMPAASVGDLLLLFVTWDSATPIGVPAGWTLIAQAAASTTIGVMLAQRLCDGTESSLVNVTGPTATGSAGVILDLGGVYKTNPVLTSTTANSG